MKLAFLRKLIYSYEHSWYIMVKNLIFSENDRAIIYIQRYLYNLHGQPDSYQLTVNDLFSLVWILYIRSNIKEIQTIQHQLSLELVDTKPLIDILIHFSLFNKKNFSKIHAIKAKKSATVIVYRLMKKHIIINQRILNAIEFLHQDLDNQLSERSIDCLILLVEHHLFARNILEFILSNDIAYWLADILPILIKADLLTEQNVIQISQCKNIHCINLLLTNLDEHILDAHILRVLCTCNAYMFSWMNDIIPVLLKINLLNRSVLSTLVCSNDELLLNMKYILKDLTTNMSDQEILNENKFYLLHTLLVKKISSLTIMCLLKNMSKQYSYKELIDFLATYDLFNENRLNIINYLHPSKRDFLLDVFKKMLNSHLSGMDKMIDLLLSFQEHLVDSTFNKSLTLTIHHLLSNKILNIDNLTALLLLKSTQMNRTCSLITNLASHHLLSQSSFNLAYQSNVPMFSIKKTEAWVVSKHKTGLSHSQLITNDNKSIFIEHKQDKKYAEGFFGKVKKGYDENHRLVYAIKKPKTNTEESLYLMPYDVASLQLCQREVKYNLLLGRKAFYFFHKKIPRSVVSWQTGCELGELNKDQIIKQPIISRLKWLISLLSDLNILHEHYRCHNDIKLDNIILDVQNKSLKLIDLGLASRPKAIGYQKDFYFDMISLSHIMLFIFPEVHFTQQKQATGCVLHDALCILYRSMTQYTFHCCRSNDALQYCQHLLTHHAYLDDEQVNEIALCTIHRHKKTVEDILHSHVTTPL